MLYCLMIMRTIFSTLLLAFLTSSSLLAQDGAARISFRCLAWDQTIVDKQFVYLAGSRSVDVIDMHTLKRSPLHKIRAAKQIIFSTNGTTPSEEMAQENKLIVKIPVGMSKALFVFIPDASVACGVRALVIDDSTVNFPWGSYRLVNTTGRPLVCWMDKAKPKAVNGPSQPINVTPGGARRNFPVAFSFKTAPKKYLFTSIWEHRPDYRRLVIITRQKDKRHGVIGLKVIPERKSELKARVQPLNRN